MSVHLDHKFAVIYVSQHFCNKIYVETFLHNVPNIDVFYLHKLNAFKFKETLRNYDIIIYLNDLTTYDFNNLERNILDALNLMNSSNSTNQVLFENYNYDCINSQILTKNKNYFENEISVIKIQSKSFIKCKNDTVYDSYINKQFNRFFIPSAIKTSLLLNYCNCTVPLSSNNTHSEFIFLQSCNNLTRTCIETTKTLQTEIFNPTLDKNINSDLTMVTGFITLNEPKIQKYSYQTYTYKDASIKTLQMDINMVIYITQDLYDFVLEKRTEFGLIHKTKIIQIQAEDYLYKFDKLADITKSVKKNHPNYSSAKKMMSVLARYNYLKDCIANNYFNSEYFAWIDFGAGHIVDIPQNIVFNNCFGNSVRIGWIARYNKSKFKYNHKVLAGGVFIGNKCAMLELIEKHNQHFNTLLDYEFVINDDKLLFFIFESNPFLFNTYFTSYTNILQRMV
jgi:hypothetical protein